MLRNNYYYNNHMPYNMYYRPAPVYPNIETTYPDESVKSIDESITPIDYNATRPDDNAKPNDNQNLFNDMFNNETEDSTRDNSSPDKDKISLFGFSIDIDDLIIIGLAIFLFLESNKKDYLLLIILGLMLFDISLDTFKNMNIFKQLFNPS